MFFRNTLSVFLAVVLTFLTPVSTYALSESQLNMFAQNNILFYDPDEEDVLCDIGKLDGNKVTLIGDSISVGAEGEFKSQIPGIDFSAKTYDGVEYKMVETSKHFSTNTGTNYGGTVIADALKNHDDLRTYVVFALGTNDAGAVTSSSIDDLMKIVGASRKVVLVTNYAMDDKQDYGVNNEAIRAAKTRYSNIAVADWANEVGKDPSKYIGDGYVHPNSVGSALFVELIKQALESLAGARYSDGPIAISGSTIEEKVWSGLTSFLTAEQAAGAMGNMYYESAGLNPAMHEQALKNRYQPGFDLGANADVSYGIGLIQWSFGRRVGVYKYIESEDATLLKYLNDYDTYAKNYSYDGNKFIELAGEDATNKLVSLELQYLKDELTNNSVYSGLLSTSSVFDAAKYFLEKIEVPANPQIEHHMNRAEKAEEFYEKYKSYIGSVCNSTSVGRLIEYVRRYVWPEHHNAPYLERMPDYADIVAERQKNHLYVGGSVGGVPGIDCGGFVTTILNESGFDPNYNYGGSGKASNVTWGQLPYVRESDEWKMVNSSVSTPIGDESMLAPGDVGFSSCTGDTVESLSCGHTYLYIGEVSGYETHIASASYSTNGISSGRAPMAGFEGITSSGVVWFHKVK